MHIAGLVQDSIVDGPGFRFTLFTQGCPHRCPGCHNPDTWAAEGGREETVEAVVAEMRKNPLTDGLTLSGGEPFEQAAECAQVAAAARADGLNVWTYTGYTFEELFAMDDPAVRQLLQLTDVLVDGRFSLAEKSFDVRWRGSRNQRLIDVAQSLAGGRAVELDESGKSG